MKVSEILENLLKNILSFKILPKYRLKQSPSLGQSIEAPSLLLFSYFCGQHQTKTTEISQNYKIRLLQKNVHDLIKFVPCFILLMTEMSLQLYIPS